jgi:undecaprenyl-diphosphatase
MSYFEALLLAILQGLTEFLPVSSSGHLILVQHQLGGAEGVDLRYDVMLHVATVMALLAYFRRDIAELWRGLLKPASPSQGVFAGQERRTLTYITLAVVPTGILGLVVKRFLVSELLHPDVVGTMLVMTGCLLWWGRGRKPQRGITITGSIMLGLERELAARFSLLISIPAILGAAALEFHHTISGPTPPLGPYCAGMAAAAIVGYVSIGLILRMVRQDHFHLFAWYLWPLGIFTILASSLA